VERQLLQREEKRLRSGMLWVKLSIAHRELWGLGASLRPGAGGMMERDMRTETAGMSDGMDKHGSESPEFGKEKEAVYGEPVLKQEAKDCEKSMEEEDTGPSAVELVIKDVFLDVEYEEPTISNPEPVTTETEPHPMTPNSPPTNPTEPNAKYEVPIAGYEEPITHLANETEEWGMEYYEDEAEEK
jgi:hypothetical protein